MFHLNYLHRRLLAGLTFAHWQRAPYSQPVQRLRIPAADGVEIGATLLSQGQPDLLIIAHGFASTQRSLGIVWLAEALLDRYDTLTFDWRGYRQSGGRATLGEDETMDLEAVLAQARTLGYHRVGLIGESMGGLLVLSILGAQALHSTQTASSLPAWYPDRIATTGAPASYLLTGPPRPQMVRYLAPRPWLRPAARLMGFRMGAFKQVQSVDFIAGIPVPLLLIHGDQDDIVPVQSAYLLHERAPHTTVRIYPGVKHGIEAMRLQVPTMLKQDLIAHFEAMQP